MALKKASLIELDANYNEKQGGKQVEVQFNPETLKVTFANQIVQPSSTGSNTSSGNTGDQSNQASRQFVGAGTTKLALQLWFDVTVRSPEEKKIIDVRELTKEVAFFITPKKEGEQYVPPAVRFLWGSFHFDGIMESLEESLEFFSDEGLPLRAGMTMNLSQQKIQEFSGQAAGAGGGPPGVAGAGRRQPGTTPLAQAPAGSNLQGLAAGLAGGGASWQDIASANGIENPRLLEPGQLINLNIRR